MTIVETLNALQSSPTADEKRSIILENNSKVLERIFSDTYSADKYNITPKNLTFGEVNGTKTIDSDYGEFHGLLLELKDREITGSAALRETQSVINEFDLNSQEILRRILDRNLCVGITKAQFDKIVGNEKENAFEVALAYNLDKVNGVNPIDGTYFASRKLDGLRCIAKVDMVNREVTFFSRQNKVFTTLDNLKSKVLDFFGGFVGVWYLDGECCLINENGDEDFQAIMKEARKKDHTIANPSYCVFDILSEEEFYGKVKSMDFSKRYELLKKLHKQSNIIVLEQERLTTQEQFDSWAEKVKKNGWEGFMLRKDCAYRSGRTKDLLKVKKFHDAEYVVKAVNFGDINYAVPGEGVKMFKNIVKDFVIVHNGCEVHVGSGLTKEQRIKYAEHPEELIGKTVTIQYFEETKNQNGGYSLRFPILKYVYENGRDC